MLPYNKKKYLESILRNGLKTNSGEIGFCPKSQHKWYKKYYTIQPIFLTNDPDYIIESMLTDKWINKNKAILLEVDVDLTDENHTCGWFVDSVEDVEPKEIRYMLDIEPNNIKVKKNLFKDS